MPKLLATTSFAALVISASLVCADEFYLANGGRIEGLLLNPDQSPRSSYVVEIASGGRLTLGGDQVQRVVVESDMQRQYRRALPNLPDTAEAHWDMAQRCKKAGLNKEQEFHLEQVLRLDPEHEQARYALGYSRIDGRWMRQGERMEEQGFVRHRGGWRLPQEIELEQKEDEKKQQTVEWRKKLRRWQDWIIKSAERRSQGEQNIREIRDPLAAPALADLLDSNKPPRPLKRLYVEVLGKLAAPDAIGALIKHALHDQDPRIRDACLDELVRLDSKAAVDAFTAALQHEKNHMVKRAAVALGRMEDPRATLPLIDALITEHKHIAGGGGGIQPTFSNRGGGLSVGGSPKVTKVKQKNEPVLHTLSSLHPGVNFGFDQDAWRRWYARHAPSTVNLRRSQ